MKKGIDYYRHACDSHTNYKFKMLRAKYGWAGEGRFWALNNMIAQSKNCELDLTNPTKKITTAAELELSVVELDGFISYLSEECDQLVQILDGRVTTKDVQEVWRTVKKKRERNQEGYLLHKKLSDYQKKISDSENEDSDSRDKDSDSRNKESDSRNKKSELTLTQQKGLMNWFGFNEITHFARLREIALFLQFLEGNNQLDHFKEQFYFYRKLKKESGERRHGFMKFLGAREEKYEDGAWNSENWKKKYAEWYEKNHEEPVRVRRRG